MIWTFESKVHFKHSKVYYYIFGKYMLLYIYIYIKLKIFNSIANLTLHHFIFWHTPIHYNYNDVNRKEIQTCHL